MSHPPKLVAPFLLGTAVLCAAPAYAQQPYPARAIRLVVPSSPGGGADITARIVAPKLSEQLGQPVVVENRAGAGTMIGTEVVARAAPDGYTLLLGISTLTINPAVYRKMPYNALKDFAPISQLVSLPNILITHPSLPVKTVKELVAFAKARPGQLNYASAGVGSNPHLSMKLFLTMTGLKMIHVPYKGAGPGIVDMVAGHVSVMTPSIISGLPHVKGGRLRALGVTSARRAGGASHFPTIAEAGVPGYEAVQWFGVLAPTGTPREIVGRLHGEMVRLLQSAEVKERFTNDGADPVGSSPEQFAAFMRAETAKWAKVVKDAGIQPE